MREAMREYVALLEQVNRAHEKLHAWLRWLVVLAAGVFSLMAGQLSGKDLPAPAMPCLKLALTLTALGILAGSVALFGEVAQQRRLVEAQRARAAQSLDDPAAAMRPAASAERPAWARRAEQACYAALLSSLFAWTAFVWLL